MGTVYVDEVFIINLIMNQLILIVSKKILRARCGWARLLSASVLGAIYSVVAAIRPQWLLQLMPLNILFSGLLVWFAFGFSGTRPYFTALGAFYIVSFGFGGAVYGVISLIQYEGQDLPLLVLFVASALAYGLITLISKHHRLKLIKEAQIVSIKITMYGKTKDISGFVDTGNTLYEPFTMRPVIVAEYKKIRELFHHDILSSNADISYIPFSSIGNDNGILQGIRPDRIEISLPDESIITDNAIIAIYKGALSVDGSYDALINPSIFKEERQ